MAETETETKLYLFYILCTRILQYVCFNTSQQIKNNMINLFFLIRSKQIYRDFILLKIIYSYRIHITITSVYELTS
jgi:hypothetical protein